MEPTIPAFELIIIFLIFWGMAGVLFCKWPVWDSFYALNGISVMVRQSHFGNPQPGKRISAMYYSLNAIVHCADSHCISSMSRTIKFINFCSLRKLQFYQYFLNFLILNFKTRFFPLSSILFAL